MYQNPLGLEKSTFHDLRQPAIENDTKDRLPTKASSKKLIVMTKNRSRQAAGREGLKSQRLKLISRTNVSFYIP